MLFIPCALLSAALFGAHITQGLLDPSSALSKRDYSQTSILTAVTLNSNSGLERREINFAPKSTCEHHYVDHTSLVRGTSARFAKTHMRFKLPALDLEEIESHLGNITCSGSVISIEFKDDLGLRQAKESWGGLGKFIVISSHPGCNADGERAPHVSVFSDEANFLLWAPRVVVRSLTGIRVSGVSYGTNDMITVLSVERVEWKSVYGSMKVDFGMTDQTPHGQYSVAGIRSHNNFRRSLAQRQAVDPSTTMYPSAPSITPSSVSSTHDISFSNSNPSIVSAGGITIGCKNCSLTGTVEITQGTFVVNSGTNEFEKAFHFIEQGFFNLVANGVIAHIELDTLVSLTASFADYISVISLPGFEIPGIAAVGPLFNAILQGSIEVANAVTLTYGFDLQVPDGSSINFDIGNLTNSSSKGFSQSKVTAIPLAATTENITTTLSLGLRAEVLLGVDLLSHSGIIEAGVFLDLPSISASISTLSNVNAHCEFVNSSSSVTGFLSHVFPKLVNIVPSVSLDVGLFASATLSVPAVLATLVSAVDFGSSIALTGTGFALHTACSSWDSAATAFVVPTFTSTSSAAAGPAATALDNSKPSGQKNVGARFRDDNPFAQKTITVCVALMILGFIVAFAAL